MDPSKQRARGFNTGKGAKGPNSKEEDNSAWYETPEQKQRRLQEEMMGSAKPASMAAPEAAKPKKSAKEEAEEQKRKQQIVSLEYWGWADWLLIYLPGEISRPVISRAAQEEQRCFSRGRRSQQTSI